MTHTRRIILTATAVRQAVELGLLELRWGQEAVFFGQLEKRKKHLLWASRRIRAAI